MNDDLMLAMLKIDLGIKTSVYDPRLAQYITSAKKEIKREGVTLSAPLSVDDANLVIHYAAWLWRKRDDNAAMPRMLRWQINNRLFGYYEDSQ